MTPGPTQTSASEVSALAVLLHLPQLFKIGRPRLLFHKNHPQRLPLLNSCLTLRGQFPRTGQALILVLTRVYRSVIRTISRCRIIAFSPMHRLLLLFRARTSGFSVRQPCICCTLLVMRNMNRTNDSFPHSGGLKATSLPFNDLDAATLEDGRRSRKQICIACIASGLLLVELVIERSYCKHCFLLFLPCMAFNESIHCY